MIILIMLLIFASGVVVGWIIGAKWIWNSIYNPPIDLLSAENKAIKDARKENKKTEAR